MQSIDFYGLKISVFNEDELKKRLFQILKIRKSILVIHLGISYYTNFNDNIK